MKVYILDADVNKYRGIYYTNSDEVVEFKRRFKGTPLGKKWTGRERFAFVPRLMPKGDTPGLSSHIPVFNIRSVEALGSFLESSGELLPITCEGERIFLFNVTRIIDALDEANCEAKRFDDGRIMRMISYSFIPERLIGVTVFKVPQLLLKDVFVTEPFVDRVKSAGLKGFKFPLVWSSDD